MIHKITSIFRFFVSELIILLLLLVVIKHYIGEVDNHIGLADGKGYYEYLPSTFIRHDILRKDFKVTENESLYKEVQTIGVYNFYKDHTVNKYTCGTAILQSPFFFYTYFTTDRSGKADDGYQSSFQETVYFATLFYLFLGLFFLKKILQLYEIKWPVIFFAQLLIVFATPITHYSHYEASMSHVYSFFAIAVFTYTSILYFKRQKAIYFIVACLILGFIFLIRQVNVLVLFSLPFLAGSWVEFKSGLNSIFSKPKWLVIGVIGFLSIVFIQLLFWHIQTGDFLVYSYQNEGFDFLNPEFINILFSYKKGLFLYTPVLLLSVLSVLIFTFSMKQYLAFTWLGFFLLITYVFSSWHYWEYGCSYGSRPYIDFYVLFFIPIALMINHASIIWKSLIVLVSFGFIYVNIVQTYQYKEYILHWINMDKAKYWTVFLQTDERFKGLVWKEPIIESNYRVVDEKKIGDFTIQKNNNQILIRINTSEISEFDLVSIIQLKIETDFNILNKSKILISIDDSLENYLWDERSILHFYNSRLNEFHTGSFNYKLNSVKKSENVTLTILSTSSNMDFNIQNAKLIFLKSKNESSLHLEQ